MKRLALVLGCLMLMTMPAMAITEFNKQWKAEFLGEDASAEFKRAAKKAGCNVCHVKGKKKKAKGKRQKAKVRVKIKAFRLKFFIFRDLAFEDNEYFNLLFRFVTGFMSAQE